MHICNFALYIYVFFIFINIVDMLNYMEFQVFNRKGILFVIFVLIQF